MRFVGTPVGTSLFINFIDEHRDGDRLHSLYQKIRQAPERRWSDLRPYVDEICGLQPLQRWIRDREEASAEIASTEKIVRRTGEDCEVYLLASDTVASRLAAQLIQSHAKVPGATFRFTSDTDVLRGLRVDDRDAFVEGMRSLIARLRRLLQARGAGQTILNMTGGYKATLPYVTIIAQLNGVPLVYRFAEADALLEVPQAPIQTDLDLIEEHEALVERLADGVEDWPRFREENYSFCEKANGLIHAEGGMAILSPLGEILWQRFQDRYNTYYATDEVEARIQDHDEIRRILATKFDALRSDHKVEQKNGHYVYDDGDNENRIYFFRENGDIYIDQVFEDHDAAERYIQTEAPDREQIVREASRRRISTK